MKLKLTIIALAALAFVQQAHAADYVCDGTLIDQRTVGVSVGDCDLNSLSAADFKRITDICGEPNGVGEDHNTVICHVGAAVVRKKNFPGIKVVTKIHFLDAELP